MTLPSLPITNGPSQHRVDIAFVARYVGAQIQFTIALDKASTITVNFRIINLQFTQGHGPIYNLGGHLEQLDLVDRKRLPPFNFVFVKYNTEERCGKMEFSNA